MNSRLLPLFALCLAPLRAQDVPSVPAEALAPTLTALYPSGNAVRVDCEPAIPLRVSLPPGTTSEAELSVTLVGPSQQAVFQWDTPVNAETAASLHELCPGPLAPGRYQVRAQLTVAGRPVLHVSSFTVAAPAP